MANAINTAVGNETTARENSDVRLQNQIDAITSASDVVDVVGTYTDLQNYDITKLTDKDLIKVMQDSTHNNALSYFRWLNNTWSYVGSEGPFYTKSENDTLLNAKQNEINSNNKLNADLVDDTNSGNKFVTTSEKQAWNNKLDEEDLADYVKNTDYAKNNKGGVVKIAGWARTQVDNDGVLLATVSNYEGYQGAANASFISKGTLENVIAGKNLETANNKVTEIDENSTDTQYPSAKAVQNSQAEQDENIEANTEEIQNILNMLPKGKATGEEITINDSANYKFNKFGIKGNTEQNSYTGKNLFSSNVIQGGRLFSNGNYFNQTNYVSNENPISVEAGKTYTLSAKNYTSNDQAGFVFFNNGTYVSFLKQQSRTFTVPNGANQVYCDICNGSNITPTSFNEYQLEEGTTATDFEPFVRTEFQVHLHHIHKR